MCLRDAISAEEALLLSNILLEHEKKTQHSSSFLILMIEKKCFIPHRVKNLHLIILNRIKRKLDFKIRKQVPAEQLSGG